MRGWKKIFHANGNQKKTGVAILISDKIHFNIKTFTRDNEGHYIMIKVSIQEDDKTIVNIYAPNIGECQYTRQMQTAIKGEINSNRKIVGDIDTPITPMDRSSKMKINEEIQALKDTLDQIYLKIFIGHSIQNNRIHFLLKCSWNILQDRSYPGSQIKPR